MILLGALAAFAGSITDAPPPPSDPARRVALLVGIDDYQDDALGDLKLAARDALDLARVLRDPEHGAFDEVHVLSGQVSEATFWDRLDSVTASLRRQDTFLLFVASHGTLTLDGSTQLYLLPSDGRLDVLAQTAISVTHLQQVLAVIPARRRAMILDTCYAGTGRSVISESSRERIARFRGPIPAPMAEAVSQAEVRMYSAHLNQPALEDSRLGNGVYTHFLIKALSGSGDLDGDGLVEAEEAFGFARDRTLEYTGGAQVPWMESQLVGRDSVYLSGDPRARRVAERALLTGLGALPGHAVVTVDGISRGAGAVEPGRRAVGISLDGQTLVDHPVRVTAGEPVNVGQLVEDRGRRWLVEAGGDIRQGSEWLAATGPRISSWYLPPDPGRGRLSAGAAVGYTIDTLPAGSVAAQSGWWWGESLMLGVTLSGGALWRVVPDQTYEAYWEGDQVLNSSELEALAPEDRHTQVAPMIAPGTALRLNRRRLSVGLTASAVSFPTVQSWVLSPQVSLTAGTWL